MHQAQQSLLPVGWERLVEAGQVLPEQFLEGLAIGELGLSHALAVLFVLFLHEHFQHFLPQLGFDQRQRLAQLRQ